MQLPKAVASVIAALLLHSLSVANAQTPNPQLLLSQDGTLAPVRLCVVQSAPTCTPACKVRHHLTTSVSQVFVTGIGNVSNGPSAIARPQL